MGREYITEIQVAIIDYILPLVIIISNSNY